MVSSRKFIWIECIIWVDKGVNVVVYIWNREKVMLMKKMVLVVEFCKKLWVPWSLVRVVLGEVMKVFV